MVINKEIIGEWLIVTVGDTEYRVPVNDERYTQVREKAEKEYRRALGGIAAETDDAEFTMREALETVKDAGGNVIGIVARRDGQNYIVRLDGTVRKVTITVE